MTTGSMMFQDNFDREAKHARRRTGMARNGSFAKGLLVAIPLAVLAWLAVTWLVLA